MSVLLNEDFTLHRHKAPGKGWAAEGRGGSLRAFLGERQGRTE